MLAPAGSSVKSLKCELAQRIRPYPTGSGIQNQAFLTPRCQERIVPSFLLSISVRPVFPVDPPTQTETPSGSLWRPLADVIFPGDAPPAVCSALRQLGVPLISGHVDPHTVSVLADKLSADTVLQTLNPGTACKALRAASPSDPAFWDATAVVSLLDFVSGGSLKGLPLLPLKNGLVRFGAPSDSPIVLASEDEAAVLSFCAERLVDVFFHPRLRETLLSADLHQTNVRLLDGKLLATLLRARFQTTPAPFPVSPGAAALAGSVNPAWLDVFWHFVVSRQYDLGLFEGIPLLPTSEGHVAKLQKGCATVLTSPETGSVVDGGLLARLGCRFVKPGFNVHQHAGLPDYVLKSDLAGVATFLRHQ